MGIIDQSDVAGAVEGITKPLFAPQSAIRAISSLPFNHSTGVTTNDTTFAVYKDITFFQIFHLTEATDHIILEFDNFHTDTASGESTGGKITISASVWVRNAMLNTFWGPKRVTFSGQPSYTLFPRTRIMADICDLGGLPFGTDIRVNIRVQAESGINYPKGRPAQWGSQGYMAGDQIENGAPTLTGDPGYGPCGLYRLGDARSGMSIFGDSRVFGTGETTGQTGGWAARRCYDLNIGTVIAAKSGEQINQWVANYAFCQNRIALASRLPYALLAWGINDLTAGRTYSQLVADFQWAIQRLYQLGVKGIIPTIMPYTQSSDSFATAGNQSRNAAFSAQAEADRQMFNANLRNGSLASTFGPGYVGFVDPCAYIEVDANNVLTPNGGRYLATGSTGAAAMTTDGLHTTTLGHTTVMPCISAALGNSIRKGTPVIRVSELV